MDRSPPGASSVLGDDPGQSLAQVITLDPVGTVAPNAQAAFGARLPFLLKVLAADEPLSLQAHPCTEHARLGFAREQAAARYLTPGSVVETTIEGIGTLANTAVAVDAGGNRVAAS